MVKIGEITNQNPWWKHGIHFDNYDPDLTKLKGSILFERKEIPLELGNIYVIRGSRRVGKTVYIKNLIRRLVNKGTNPRRILYLSLDFFTSRRELRSAINYFLDSNRGVKELYIFLDEITSIPEWELELKYLADVGVTQRAVIVATGSSGVALGKRIDLLPGRGIEGNEYYMKPLTFREFVSNSTLHILDHIEDEELYSALRIIGDMLNIQDIHVDLAWSIEQIFEAVNNIAPYIREIDFLFNIYLVTGGFPQAINSYLEKFDERRVNPSLAEVFMRNVIGDISKLGKQEVYARRILREVLSRYGTRYSIRSLASAVELNHRTVYEYLETLVESFILTILYSYDPNMDKVRYKGDKKIYFQDPFIYYSIASYLTGIDVNQVIDNTLADEDMLSRLIEGVVCMHIASNMERPLMKGVDTFLWYYYNHRGKEIDFLTKTDEGLTSIEVKYRRKVNPRDAYRHPKIDKYILLSKEDIELWDDTLVIPIPLFLLLLKKNRYVL